MEEAVNVFHVEGSRWWAGGQLHHRLSRVLCLLLLHGAVVEDEVVRYGQLVVGVLSSDGRDHLRRADTCGRGRGWGRGWSRVERGRQYNVVGVVGWVCSDV